MCMCKRGGADPTASPLSQVGIAEESAFASIAAEGFERMRRASAAHTAAAFSRIRNGEHVGDIGYAIEASLRARSAGRAGLARTYERRAFEGWL